MNVKLLRMIKFKTTSPEQTEKFGREFAKSLCGGDVIALTGDLGAGKTCLTRGIADGLGSTSYVSSPTFTIVNEYDGGRLMLFHFDTYRLSGSDDFLMSGLDEYFFRNGVCVIEWSDIIDDLLPEDTIRMTIKGDGNTRSFECECPEKYQKYMVEAALKVGAETEE
ncbi:tRNA threonylcarbamoyladenosine biosynthesis protein TsaE [Ruminococcaceae bacterium YAD3003]|nr:tRNA threonylcarbamoyladenosine biosynthesis protein TsaE [Ruminococcaceae bacterium YAD3003]